MEVTKDAVQSSFDATLRDVDFGDVVIDIAEIPIDNLLDDGTIFQEIPIVKIFVMLAKIGANIHDKLFLKKILSFINGLKGVSAKERREMILEIDGSKKYRIKVGEKLLYIIDSCNDYENSELVARLFEAFVEKKISYDDFLNSANIVTRIMKGDFHWFLDNAKDGIKVEEVGSLVGSGLFDLQYEPVDIRVEDQDDWKAREKYKTEVEGGYPIMVISRAGKIIIDVFEKESK